MNHLIKLLLPIFIVGFLTSPLVGDEKDYNSNQTNLIRKMKELTFLVYLSKMWIFPKL